MAYDALSKELLQEGAAARLITQLRKECDEAQTRVDACGSCARGESKPKEGEPCWSPSIDDVLVLRTERDSAWDKLDGLRIRLSSDDTMIVERSDWDALMKDRDGARAELAGIQRLPELDWARACAVFTSHLAALARAGHQPAAQGAMEALDGLKTYVNRLRARSDVEK